MGLSYSHLFDFVRKERASQELQELAPSFYEESQALVTELTVAAQNDRLAGETAILQLANSRKLLRELYDRREQKVVLLAQNRARTGSQLIDSANLLPRERQLFDRIVQVLVEHRLGSTTTTIERTEMRRITVETVAVTEKTVEVSPPALAHEDAASVTPPRPAPIVERTVVAETEVIEARAPQEEVITVHVVHAVPQFYGKDMQVFGPYAVDEEVELPAAVANLLIRKGSAERVGDATVPSLLG